MYFNSKGENIENNYVGMKSIDELNMFITTNDKNLYGLMDKDGKVVVPNTYLYIDYAFDQYFVAFKEGKGHGVIDKSGNTIVDFEYDIFSRVGDKELLKAVKMEKDGDITIIFSKDLKRLATMKAMAINIDENYIEVYNNEERLFINASGEVKKARELFNENKLFANVSNGKWGFETKER